MMVILVINEDTIHNECFLDSGFSLPALGQPDPILCHLSSLTSLTSCSSLMQIPLRNEMLEVGITAYLVSIILGRFTRFRELKKAPKYAS